MYNLMIVEDEYNIRKGITESINWSELGFNVIAEAENGRDAIKKIRSEVPDVILTDVRMPVMNGLELSDWISKNLLDIKIIILSGYADFEYAKAAINSGVFDYLLKPTNKKVFLQTFMKLKEHLDNERDKNRLINEKTMLFLEGLYKLRSDFINHLIKSDIINVSTLVDNQNHLELDLSSGYSRTAVIRVDEDFDGYFKSNETDYLTMMDKYNRTMSKYIPELSITVYSVISLNEIVLVLPSVGDKEIDKCITDKLNMLATILKTEILNNPRIKIHFGVSLPFRDIEAFKESYNQAVKAIDNGFFQSENNLFYYNPTLESGSDDEQHWLKNYQIETERLIELTVAGRKKELIRSINDVFESYISDHINVKYIKQYSYFGIFLLQTHLSDINILGRVQDSFNTDYESHINSFTNIEGLKKYFIDFFTGISDLLRNDLVLEHNSSRKIINESITYIDRNYFRSLSLEELSNQVNLSPSYFSFLFKNVTGENYTEYLKKLRIKKAIEYLKETNMKIYEIANKVGFNDYKYFASQFKKTTGTSPGEYRDRVYSFGHSEG